VHTRARVRTAPTRECVCSAIMLICWTLVSTSLAFTARYLKVTSNLVLARSSSRDCAHSQSAMLGFVRTGLLRLRWLLVVVRRLRFTCVTDSDRACCVATAFYVIVVHTSEVPSSSLSSCGVSIVSTPPVGRRASFPVAARAIRTVGAARRDTPDRRWHTGA
jgi:hypothetical protein